MLASVTFIPGTVITRSELEVDGVVSGLSEAVFLANAEQSKANCPVSQALRWLEITLSAVLRKERAAA